jgi:signal transduction histidine kinase
VLDALAVLVAIAAVLIAFRASRQHDRLVQSHSALLRERVAELDRFSGRVAHDILSPLDTIGFGLALLAPSSDARQQTYVARAQRALQSVQRLVGDLLTFARSGARPGAQAVCALDSVLAEVVADCEEQARAADVELIVPPAHGLELACSPGVATSIVQNLVRNAIKYMGNAPVRKVIVRAERAGAVARLEVEDTGPGIPAERQLTIFEPFIRGPHEEAGGIGLGLATVKRLVEAHGGSVTVRSQVGAGSVFRVDLPLAVNPPSISVA